MQIAFAGVTSYPVRQSQDRESHVLEFATKAKENGIPLFIADFGSSDFWKEKLLSAAKDNTCILEGPLEQSSLAYGRRMIGYEILQHPQIQRVIFTSLENVHMVYLAGIIAKSMRDKESSICYPTRDDANFHASCSRALYHSEIDANKHMNVKYADLGWKNTHEKFLDASFGVFALNRDMLLSLVEYESVSDESGLFFAHRAMRYKLAMSRVVIPFGYSPEYPDKQPAFNPLDKREQLLAELENHVAYMATYPRLL